MINNYHFDTTPPILSHTNSLKLINNNNRMKYSLLLKSIFTPKSCNNNFKLQIKYFSKNSHLSEEELSQKIDHYSLLGLSFNSDNKAIKSAYYAKCKIYHPDSKVDQNARINSQTRADNFRKIAEAYECLIDPVKRQEYDKILFAKKSRMYENGSDFDKARKGFEKNRSSYRNVSNRYGSSFYDSSDDQNESTYDPNFWSARFEDQLKYQEDFDHASKNRPAQPYESRWWLARLEAMNTLNHKRNQNHESKERAAPSKEDFYFRYKNPSSFYQNRDYFENLYRPAASTDKANKDAQFDFQDKSKSSMETDEFDYAKNFEDKRVTQDIIKYIFIATFASLMVSIAIILLIRDYHKSQYSKNEDISNERGK